MNETRSIALLNETPESLTEFISQMNSNNEHKGVLTIKLAGLPIHTHLGVVCYLEITATPEILDALGFRSELKWCRLATMPWGKKVLYAMKDPFEDQITQPIVHQNQPDNKILAQLTEKEQSHFEELFAACQSLIKSGGRKTHPDHTDKPTAKQNVNTEYKGAEEEVAYGPSKKMIVLAKNSPFDKNNLDWIEDPVLGKQYSIDSFEIDVDSFTLNKNKLTLPLLGFHADNECELICPSQVKICNPGEIGFSLYFGPNNDAFFSIRGAKKLRLKVLYEVLDTALTYKARQVYAYIVTAE